MIKPVAYEPYTISLGLTGAEARSRLQQNGPNALPEKPPRTIWQRFLRQFQSPERRAADWSSLLAYCARIAEASGGILGLGRSLTRSVNCSDA